MSNVLSYEFKRVGHTNNYDVSTVKDTQQKLKRLPNNELPLEMLKSVVKSMSEGKLVVSELCKSVDKWIMTSNKNSYGVSLDMNYNLNNLLEELKLQDDYVRSYVFQDNKTNIWIIVEDADYNTSIKYVKLAKQELDDQYLKTNVMIYSKDEVDEVLEELEGSNYSYKVF